MPPHSGRLAAGEMRSVAVEGDARTLLRTGRRISIRTHSPIGTNCDGLGLPEGLHCAMDANTLTTLRRYSFHCSSQTGNGITPQLGGSLALRGF